MFSSPPPQVPADGASLQAWVPLQPDAKHASASERMATSAGRAASDLGEVHVRVWRDASGAPSPRATLRLPGALGAVSGAVTKARVYGAKGAADTNVVNAERSSSRVTCRSVHGQGACGGGGPGGGRGQLDWLRHGR